MTEKHYGGSSSFGFKDRGAKASSSAASQEKASIKDKGSSSNNKEISENLNKFIEAGKIASQAREYIKKIVKKDVPLLEIAEKVEDKIKELGGKPAFPVTLSINEVAAHSTPSYDDKTLAHGLIKVDFGVSIDGCCADTALSIDLENSEVNKKLIKSAEDALKKALEVVKKNVEVSQIGKAIENSVKKDNLQPVQNLSGHSIEIYNLHAGMNIPNIDNSSTMQLEEGVYAIEPFVTTGLGSVKDSRPSGIYHVESPGNVRDNFAREVLAFIDEEYQTLPFCSRWIYRKFGSRGLLALKRLQDAKILHHYSALVEKGSGIVAQAEHTVIITGNKVIVTTQ